MGGILFAGGVIGAIAGGFKAYDHEEGAKDRVFNTLLGMFAGALVGGVVASLGYALFGG